MHSARSDCLGLRFPTSSLRPPALDVQPLGLPLSRPCPLLRFHVKIKLSILPISSWHLLGGRSTAPTSTCNAPVPLYLTYVIFLGLVAECHSFCLFFIFYNLHTFIQSHSYNTFIHRHSLRPLSISSSLLCSVGKTSLWCRAENRTRACLTASRRATYLSYLT